MSKLFTEVCAHIIQDVFGEEHPYTYIFDCFLTRGQCTAAYLIKRTNFPTRVIKRNLVSLLHQQLIIYHDPQPNTLQSTAVYEPNLRVVYNFLRTGKITRAASTRFGEVGDKLLSHMQCLGNATAGEVLGFASPDPSADQSDLTQDLTLADANKRSTGMPASGNVSKNTKDTLDKIFAARYVVRYQREDQIPLKDLYEMTKQKVMETDFHPDYANSKVKGKAKKLREWTWKRIFMQKNNNSVELVDATDTKSVWDEIRRNDLQVTQEPQEDTEYNEENLEDQSSRIPAGLDNASKSKSKKDKKATKVATNLNTHDANGTDDAVTKSSRSLKDAQNKEVSKQSNSKDFTIKTSAKASKTSKTDDRNKNSKSTENGAEVEPKASAKIAVEREVATHSKKSNGTKAGMKSEAGYMNPIEIQPQRPNEIVNGVKRSAGDISIDVDAEHNPDNIPTSKKRKTRAQDNHEIVEVSTAHSNDFEQALFDGESDEEAFHLIVCPGLRPIDQLPCNTRTIPQGTKRKASELHPDGIARHRKRGRKERKKRKDVKSAKHSQKPNPLKLVTDYKLKDSLPDVQRVRLEYDKIDVALRSDATERLAHTKLGEPTAKVFCALMRCVEKFSLRCFEPEEAVRSYIQQEYEREEADEDRNDRMDIDGGAGSLHIPSGTTPGQVWNPRITTEEIGEQLGTRIDHDIDQEWGSVVKKEVESVKDARASRQKKLKRKQEYIEQRLMILEEDPCHFVQRVGPGDNGFGLWEVDFHSLVRSMVHEEIYKSATHQLGTLAARILRLLKSEGSMQLKTVAHFTMSPRQDVELSLGLLMQYGYVENMLWPSDTARKAENAEYTVHFDYESSRDNMVKNSYQMISRMFQRLKSERKHAKISLYKVGVEATLGLDSEAQLAQSESWRKREQHFLAQIGRIDDTVAMCRDFIPPGQPKMY